MAYTPRYGFSYFGAGVPGNMVEDGAKFTLLDPLTLDRILDAMESHDHTGGLRVQDPADAPMVTLEETGGQLPAGRTFYYGVTFVDRFGLETAISDEDSVETKSPIPTPASPSVDPGEGGVTITDAIVVAGFAAVQSESAAFTAKDVGRPITIQNVGANGGPLATKIEAVTDARTAVLENSASFQSLDTGNRAVIERGQLKNELYQYALTILSQDGEQETTLSVPVPVSPPVNGIVTVTMPSDVPEGAEEFQIWRKGTYEGGFTRIGTTSEVNFVDDGSVPADECACDPEHMPPTVNTTNGTSQAIITLSPEDQHTLADPDAGVMAWRIYRTQTPGGWPARSLVAQVSASMMTSLEDPSVTYQIVSYTDTGETPLALGAPPRASTTLTPTHPLPFQSGPLPVDENGNVDIDLPNWLPWLDEALQLWVLTPDREWNRVVGDVALGSIRNDHVAGDAAIEMGKVALDPLLTRVATLEEGASGDADAVHYRGTWTSGTAYAANDLVQHQGAWYLTPEAQAAPEPADGGYTADFSNSVPPEFDQLGNSWYATGGGTVMTEVTGTQLTYGSTPLLYDTGSTTSQDFTVTPQNTNATALWVGLTDDHLNGYLVYLNGTFAALHRVENGVGTLVTSTDFGATVPDYSGMPVRLEFRQTDPSEGAFGAYGIELTIDGNDVIYATETPTFAPGSWVGFGPDGNTYSLYYLGFELAAPLAEEPQFDPALWINLNDALAASRLDEVEARLLTLEATPIPPDLTSRLDALEARAATALHFRGEHVSGEWYEINDLVTDQTGQVYRCTVRHQAGEEITGVQWTEFPPT